MYSQFSLRVSVNPDIGACGSTEQGATSRLNAGGHTGVSLSLASELRATPAVHYLPSTVLNVGEHVTVSDVSVYKGVF